VVIEKIDQYSSVKTKGLIEPLLAAKKMEVLARKGIDFPVKQNPLFNTGRETPAELTFDKITHEISNKDFRSVTREKKVGKKIHKLISYPSPVRVARGKKGMA
jgi:hypothetical protein